MLSVEKNITDLIFGKQATLIERPQLLTFFVAQRNQRGEFILGPKPYRSREEAQSYIASTLRGHGHVVLAAGNVRIEPVREQR